MGELKNNQQTMCCEMFTIQAFYHHIFRDRFTERIDENTHVHWMVEKIIQHLPTKNDRI